MIPHRPPAGIHAPIIPMLRPPGRLAIPGARRLAMPGAPAGPLVMPPRFPMLPPRLVVPGAPIIPPIPPMHRIPAPRSISNQMNFTIITFYHFAN